MNSNRPISRLLGLLLLLPLTVGAQTSTSRTKPVSRPEVRSVVITVETVDASGQTHKVQERVAEPDVKKALGVARSLLLGSMELASEPVRPIYRIFYCGGDITKSDGTCDSVKNKCKVIRLEFKCDNQDATGACTSGGC